MFHFSVANWTPKLNNQSFVESELSKAFKMWSDYSRLEFVKSDDYYGSDIVIAFGRYSHGDSYPFDGPGHSEAKVFIKSYLLFHKLANSNDVLTIIVLSNMSIPES